MTSFGHCSSTEAKPDVRTRLCPAVPPEGLGNTERNGAVHPAKLDDRLPQTRAAAPYKQRLALVVVNESERFLTSESATVYDAAAG